MSDNKYSIEDCKMYIGPFFYIKDVLYVNTCTLAEGRTQADKLDNSYGHDKLYEDHFKDGDYIDYPRGRVVFDLTNWRSIIYIDPCINKPQIIKKIVKAFNIDDYVIEFDDHYHCKNCVGDLFK